MKKRIILALGAALTFFSFDLPSNAAERPTLNHNTCDPRPDILTHPWYHARPEYRQVYNRPRYWSGWIAHRIAPTSQEAMVWCENKQAGAYAERNMPPRYKRYFAPKPWEVLQTSSRPDFPKPKKMVSMQEKEPQSPSDRPINLVEESPREGDDQPENETNPVPAPLR